MTTKNYLSIYAKSFNWSGFFLPKKIYFKCSVLYDFCRTIDNIADQNVDLDTKKKFCRNSQTDFVEIKTEVKIYDDLIPIFRTLIGIISKQQKEINQLKNVSN